MRVLAVEEVCLDVGGYLLLPLVSIIEQLLLIIEQLFMCLSGELKVWALYYGIYRAGLLAEPTVDTFGHVNIISCGSPASICPCLCLYRDSLSRTDGLTELAGNAPLLPIGVSPKGMLSPKARTKRTLLKRVHQSNRLTEEC